MSSDLFATMRQLSHGPRNIGWLNAEDCKTLQSLGLGQLERSRYTTVEGKPLISAQLTPEGRTKLREINTADSTPSPVGPRASRQLSDNILLTLDGLRSGNPPSDLAAQALVSAGLACQHHGILSLTRRGADLLFNASTQARLAALKSPHRRG